MKVNDETTEGKKIKAIPKKKKKSKPQLSPSGNEERGMEIFRARQVEECEH